MTTLLLKNISSPFKAMIEGKVFTGEGKASDFLSLDPYKKFIDNSAGFEPYPGTLNLRVGEEEAEMIREQADMHRMDPVEHEGRELGGLNLYEVKINGKKCCVVEPDLTRYGDDVLEIVAPCNLRERFGLEDGDTASIAI